MEPARSGVARFLIGTSGYQYEDWRGPFYPADLPKARWLGYYAERFPAVELNFTYYRMPDARQLARMAERAGGRLRFAVKLHRSLTHERPEDPRGPARTFRDALSPLREAGAMGPLLVQFPFSFRPAPGNEDYLRRLLDELTGLPVAVEMRHSAWFGESLRTMLRRRQAALVAVDLPALRDLPSASAERTAPFAYVRFHGRNAAQWWQHARPSDRYDHRYTAEELQPWIPRLASMAEGGGEVWVFTNNHYLGKAVEAADLLSGLLAAAGLCEMPPRPQAPPRQLSLPGMGLSGKPRAAPRTTTPPPDGRDRG